MTRVTIKQRIAVILFCILLLILDNTTMPFLNIVGAFPSLLFVFAISYSIILGESEGVFIGVVSGLLQDIFFFNGLGINAFTNLIICFLAAKIGENIFRNKKIIPILSGFLLSILKLIIITVIVYCFKIEVPIIDGIVVAFYNTVIMWITYGIIFKFFDDDYSKSSWRFK